MARSAAQCHKIGAVAILAALLTIGLASPGAAQSARIEQLFERFDIDRDGRISRDEFEQKKVEIIFAGASGRGAALKFEDTRISRDAFNAIDFDHDGVLSAGEVMSSPLFRFDAWDANSDGYIDREEFAAQLRRIER